jgi:hypothetical protein
VSAVEVAFGYGELGGEEKGGWKMHGGREGR